jgi:hypothetical protein
MRFELVQRAKCKVAEQGGSCVEDPDMAAHIPSFSPDEWLLGESQGCDAKNAKDVVIVAPLTFELSTDTRVQLGTVRDKQIDSVVKFDLDSSPSRLILSQSTSSLGAFDLAAHEQKFATYDVTANFFNPSSSPFKSFFAHVAVLPLLAAADSVSPTCLECLESGPSKKRNNTCQMPKALRHRKAKAKQKAKTDVAYCALLFKANRHRKATAKLKKNVEVSPVPPSLQYSPRTIRKLN